MKVAWKVILFFIGAIVGIGVYFTNKIMYIKKKEELSDLKEWDGLKQEIFYIPSHFGYTLYTSYISKEESNKVVILCHGVTANHRNSLKYGKIFLELGFHVIMYDHRRHGESGGKTTSYGYYEKQDLKTIVEWVKKKFGESTTIGLHGESMGAATILQYGGTVEDTVDFYIADCPFSTFTEQVAYRLNEEFHLPKWPVLPIANFILKIRDGYTFRDVSPLQAVKNIEKPVLFIHSKEDTYIPFQMTEELYRAKNGAKQLYLAEVGDHAQSYVKNPDEYKKTIEQFIYKHTDYDKKYL